MSTTVIAKNYRGLADVRLTMSAGVSAVVGANGAGKTTLGFIGDILKRATASGMSTRSRTAFIPAPYAKVSGSSRATRSAMTFP